MEVTGKKMGRGNSGIDRGRGSKGADWCSNVMEIREIWRSEIVDSFEGKEDYFIIDVMSGKPL